MSHFLIRKLFNLDVFEIIKTAITGESRNLAKLEKAQILNLLKFENQDVFLKSYILTFIFKNLKVLPSIFSLYKENQTSERKIFI